MDLEEEVVVITGGASGLGRCLAEIYALRGAIVAVMDVQAAGSWNPIEGVGYYQCDVGNTVLVKTVWEKITRDVCIAQEC